MQNKLKNKTTTEDLTNKTDETTVNGMAACNILCGLKNCYLNVHYVSCLLFSKL